jgi:RNA polymerase sigma factor (sigma-70 family)
MGFVVCCRQERRSRRWALQEVRAERVRVGIRPFDRPDGEGYGLAVEHPADDPIAPTSKEVAETLVANHRAFLAFVQKRVGDRALAEDILQDAFVRGVEKFDAVRDTAVGWFYRVLRNAIIDHHRRTAVAERRREKFVADSLLAEDDDKELQAVVCGCVAQLAETLRPEYAAALRRIEIDGVSVKDYAAEAGISSNNAGVRVFRAREALRKQVVRACGTCAEHGCLDCTCGTAA